MSADDVAAVTRPDQVGRPIGEPGTKGGRVATVSDKAWSQFSGSDYTDAGDYCDAALINLNTGARSGWTKDRCKLPVREPKGGPLNRNAVHAAAGRLLGAGGGVDAPPEAKRAAARDLIRLYGQLGEDPPETLRQLAK